MWSWTVATGARGCPQERRPTRPSISGYRISARCINLSSPPFGLIPNPCRGREGEREDQDNGRPYGGSLESLCCCSSRLGSTNQTGWDALNPFGSTLFVREIRTEIWIFHESFLHDYRQFRILEQRKPSLKFELSLATTKSESEKIDKGFFFTLVYVLHFLYYI